MNLTTQATMTSVELVEVINAFRKEKAEAAGQKFPSEGFAKLEHGDFLKKVPEVLGKEVAGNFSGYYTASNGKKNPCYILPKRESCLLAMSYSYELQARVYDRMTALEEHAAPALPGPNSRATADTPDKRLTAAERGFRAGLKIAKLAGLSGNQATFAADRLVQREMGCSPLRMIGVTSIATEDNERTYTPSELCAKLKGSWNPRALNKKLEEMGLQEHVDLGGKSKEWELTESGREHGVMNDTGKVHTTTGQSVFSVRWKPSVLALIKDTAALPIQGSMNV
ncbi:hypothetical protein [Pseudomonas sp. REB1044]|uniref:hypothetical protein n=1 Tax=Pseudomonas sp. REB1044 TaxID=2675224 RepID=UPI00315D0C9A